jgi:hypothetical protein
MITPHPHPPHESPSWLEYATLACSGVGETNVGGAVMVAEALAAVVVGTEASAGVGKGRDEPSHPMTSCPKAVEANRRKRMTCIVAS